MRILKSTHTVQRLAERHAGIVHDLQSAGKTPRLDLVRTQIPDGMELDRRQRGQVKEVGAYAGSLHRYARRIGSAIALHTENGGLIDTVHRLDKSDDTDGVLLLSPFIGVSSEVSAKVLDSVSPHKDVDGLSQASRESGRGFFPSTALATYGLIKANGIDPSSSETVVTRIGNGVTVGRPLGIIHENHGVEEIVITHKNDERELRDAIHKSDIVVAATGVAGIVRADMLHDGQVVVGVGAHDIDDGVYAAAAAGLDIAVTRHGGVGPLTSAFTHEHMLQSARGEVVGGLATLNLVEFGYEQQVQV